MNREITKEQLLENNGENGRPLWVLIKGNVYDMSTFKHPGGKDILMEEIGEDRWDEFDGIHSTAAREKMKEYHIGIFKSDKKANEKNYKKTDGDKAGENGESSNVLAGVVILVVAMIAGLLYYYKSHSG